MVVSLGTFTNPLFLLLFLLSFFSSFLHDKTLRAKTVREVTTKEWRRSDITEDEEDGKRVVKHA